MKKSALYISTCACRMGLGRMGLGRMGLGRMGLGLVCLSLVGMSACEKTETALIDDEVQQTAKKQNNAKKPIKITAGKPARPTPVTQEPEYINVTQGTSPAKPAKDVQPTQRQAQTLPAPRRPVRITPSRATPFKIKRCMNMGNALEAENEGDWGYRITARDLRQVAAAGFDTVRIPIRWDTHTAHRPPYDIDARFMTRIKTVVRDAQSAGLGVIIDVHHYENLMTRTARETPRFVAIWDQIARTFSGAPDTVYFEVLNEPTLDITNAQVDTLYAKVLPIIRASNPNRKIILGGNSWNSVESLSKINWSKWSHDANLVATFHDYGPHEFTHQGAEWSEPVMPMGRRWGGEADMAEMRDTYQIARKFKAKTGLPIFVGEFGVIDKVPLAERNQWVKARRKTIEANGYSWCAWDFSGAFKSYDTSTRTWLPGTQDAFFGR